MLVTAEPTSAQHGRLLLFERSLQLERHLLLPGKRVESRAA